MRYLLAFFLIAMLVFPKMEVTPSEEKISIWETVTYLVDVNPLTGYSTAEYKSTITIVNEGQSTVEYAFIQRIFGVNISTLSLPKEAQLLESSEGFCLVKWVINVNPGTKVFEVSGRPIWLPLGFNTSIRVNGAKPNYTSAYGAFFINSKEGDFVEWEIQLKNNNPVLLDPLTNLSSRPPLFVSASITIPKKYFGAIAFKPSTNTTSPLDKDSVSWVFVLRDNVNMKAEAVINGFDDWGTIPLATISISFSPIRESVEESIRSQVNSLNMSMQTMETLLSSLTNLTDFTDLMKDVLGNLSYGLTTTGNQTVIISDALMTMGYGLGSATAQLSKAVSQFSTILENISKVDFNELREGLNTSKQIAGAIVNQTYKVIVYIKQDLLEINNTLTSIRDNLTDPYHRNLIDDAITRVNNLYNRLDFVEGQLESIESQMNPIFRGLESSLKMLEQYRSEIIKMGSGFDAGISALSQVSSALSEISSALRLLGEANMMMGGNVTIAVQMVENATHGLRDVQRGLGENLTAIRNAYNELSLLLRLMEHESNRMYLLAPELQHEDGIAFRLELETKEGLLELSKVILENDTVVGVRSIKVIHEGIFKGIIINGSKYASDPSKLGISITGNSIIIEQFRFHDKGNVLTLWNGQELKLLFAEDSEIRVEVDYSLVRDLGQRSEALIYSIIQPTFGKAVSITVKPSEETALLKSGLNVVTVILILVSIAIVAMILYKSRRRAEILIT